jgi:hypothetical protein
LTTARMRLLALGSAAVAITMVPLVPIGAPILIGALTAVTALLVFDR